MTILLSTGLAYVLSSILDIHDYMLLSYLSVGMFAGLCLMIYRLSERASKMANKRFFMQIVMINTMIKMFGAVILVILYYKFAQPHTTLFIVPFIVVYIVFSIFETYFMMKQSRHATRP